jgi:hypothetical protein
MSPRGRALAMAPGQIPDDPLGKPVGCQVRPAQMCQEFGGGWPVSGILGQAALDHGPHQVRQVIKARLPVDDTVDQRVGPPGAERARSRGGKVSTAPG